MQLSKDSIHVVRYFHTIVSYLYNNDDSTKTNARWYCGNPKRMEIEPIKKVELSLVIGIIIQQKCDTLRTLVLTCGRLDITMITLCIYIIY